MRCDHHSDWEINPDISARTVRRNESLPALLNEVKTPETPIIVEGGQRHRQDVRLILFPAWQSTLAAEREVKKSLRKPLFKYKLRSNEELRKRYNYVREDY